MTDDRQAPEGAENAHVTSDQPPHSQSLTELSETAHTHVEATSASDADTGAGPGNAAAAVEVCQETKASGDLQSPVQPFETIRDTQKGLKAAKAPPPPEEQALRWLEAAAGLVRELPHDPRWPVSTGEQSLRARLWVVRDRLVAFSKKPPKEFCIIPPGPSAQELRVLFGQVVSAIRECKDTTEEVPKTWGEWNPGREETILRCLLELAEGREAKLPEPSEMIGAGRMSPHRVDAGVASIARELHRHLTQ